MKNYTVLIIFMVSIEILKNLKNIIYLRKTLVEVSAKTKIKKLKKKSQLGY